MDHRTSLPLRESMAKLNPEGDNQPIAAITGSDQ